MALALFDVDGTLLHSPSSEKSFFVYLLTRGLIRTENIVEGMRFYRERRQEYGPHIFQKNKAYLAGLPVDEVSALAERFVETSLLVRLRRPVRARLEAHAEAGHKVALITGTPSFIAAPLARALGATYWRGTTLATLEGRFAPGPLVFHPFGETKIAAAHEVCEEAAIPLGECHAYADSIHDLPLLVAVRHAIAVHPDRALRREALARGWELISYRTRFVAPPAWRRAA